MRRRLLLLWLPLFMLLAQQGSYWHELTHYRDAGSVSSHKQDGAADAPCELCLAFSGVASAAPLPQLDFAPLRFEQAFAAAPHASAATADAPAARSRGPPTLL